MDRPNAAILLASMLERIERDQNIGSVSSLERNALRIALEALGYSAGLPSAPPQTLVPPVDGPTSLSVGSGATQTQPAAPALPVVDLNVESISRAEVTDSKLLMCLDFGTAMSKAFATVFPNKHLDLELGTAGGSEGYALPSTVFIGDDGKAYFGAEALERSQNLGAIGRARVDSIKGSLSLRSQGNLDSEGCVLPMAMNPTPYKLTEGDMIRVYLAYLTDVAARALGEKGVAEPRYVKRRFARPCWPDPAQSEWADSQLRTMLAEAQILADTFSGNWLGGIEVGRLKGAIEQIKRLDKRPDYLISDGVPEPVAVAAGAFADRDNERDAFIVVDAGAGTTDFGLFVSTRRTEGDDDRVRIFQVPASIQGLMQAGDKVDGMLRGVIARKESIDQSDKSGQLILADLNLRIRSLKEALFKSGTLEYALADGTLGTITLDEFLEDITVKRFADAIEVSFKKALEAVDESWLRWLAMDPVRLHVVLTGGSSPLPMMQALGTGTITIKGHHIRREKIDPTPEWMETMPDELVGVYPQLAVAIGGAAETIPETYSAPLVHGGGTRTTYVAGHLHVAGS